MSTKEKTVEIDSESLDNGLKEIDDKNLDMIKYDAIKNKTDDKNIMLLNGDSFELVNNVNTNIQFKKIINPVYKNNIKINNIDNYNKKMDKDIFREEIFPEEREASIKLSGSLTPSHLSVNEEQSINKKSILEIDIPEMILMKYYKNPKKLKDSLILIDFETEWIYDQIINDLNKNNKNNDEEGVKNCIKKLLNFHKKDLYDIPTILKIKKNEYIKYLSPNKVKDILSIYDVLFLKLQEKKKLVLYFYDKIISQKFDSYYDSMITQFKEIYIDNASSVTELELIATYLAKILYINDLLNNEPSTDEIQKVLNIANNELSIAKVNKLDDIIKEMGLCPEYIAYNLKNLKEDKKGEMKIPNENKKLTSELSTNKINANLINRNQVMSKVLESYISLICSHPYISNLIFKAFLESSTISTFPISSKTNEKKLKINHEFYECKNIKERPLKELFDDIKYKESDLFAKILKAKENKLIDFKININLHSNNISEIKILLNKAINGYTNKMDLDNIKNNYKELYKKDEINDNDFTNYQKYVAARKIAIENLFKNKIYLIEPFKETIENEMKVYSEFNIIKKACDEFYLRATRNYLNEEYDANKSLNIISIIYNKENNTFLCLKKNTTNLNSNIEENDYMKLIYLFNEEDLEINQTLEKNSERVNFRKLFIDQKIDYVIVDISSLESQKMIKLLKSIFDDKIEIVKSDYISLTYNIKKNNDNENIDTYYKNLALEQIRFILYPINQLIEFWNYYYDGNLLLNLNLHPLQDCITKDDIIKASFNYILEVTIQTVVNEHGMNINLKNYYTYNYIKFLSGSGNETGENLIKENKMDFLFKNNSKIFENLKHFIKDENSMDIEEEFPLMNTNILKYFSNIEIFEAMIKDNKYIKEGAIRNAIISKIDKYNEKIECNIIHNCDLIKAYIPYSKINAIYKNTIYKFYKKNEIITCKISQIKLEENKIYELEVSALTNDLIKYDTNIECLNHEENDIKDFIELNKINEKMNKFYDELDDINNNLKIENNKENHDNSKIYELEGKKMKLKNIEFLKISTANLSLLKNYDYENMTKFLKGSFNTQKNKIQYIIRSSYLGNNENLILNIYLGDELYIYYIIKIVEIKLDNNLNPEKKYYIGGLEYSSLTKLENDFIKIIVKKLNEVKKNRYYKSTEICNKLIQNINNHEKIKKLYKDIKNIVISFLFNDPRYCLIFYKNLRGEYCIDFIKIKINGFEFHGNNYESLDDITCMCNDTNAISNQNFIDFSNRQVLILTHSFIQEYDKEFEGFSIPGQDEKKKENENNNDTKAKINDDAWGDSDNNYNAQNQSKNLNENKNISQNINDDNWGDDYGDVNNNSNEIDQNQINNIDSNVQNDMSKGKELTNKNNNNNGWEEDKNDFIINKHFESDSKTSYNDRKENNYKKINFTQKKRFREDSYNSNNNYKYNSNYDRNNSNSFGNKNNYQKNNYKNNKYIYNQNNSNYNKNENKTNGFVDWDEPINKNENEEYNNYNENNNYNNDEYWGGENNFSTNQNDKIKSSLYDNVEQNNQNNQNENNNWESNKKEDEDNNNNFNWDQFGDDENNKEIDWELNYEENNNNQNNTNESNNVKNNSYDNYESNNNNNTYNNSNQNKNNNSTNYNNNRSDNYNNSNNNYNNKNSNYNRNNNINSYNNHNNKSVSNNCGSNFNNRNNYNSNNKSTHYNNNQNNNNSFDWNSEDKSNKANRYNTNNNSFNKKDNNNNNKNKANNNSFISNNNHYNNNFRNNNNNNQQTNNRNNSYDNKPKQKAKKNIWAHMSNQENIEDMKDEDEEGINLMGNNNIFGSIKPNNNESNLKKNENLDENSNKDGKEEGEI